MKGVRIKAPFNQYSKYNSSLVSIEEKNNKLKIVFLLIIVDSENKNFWVWKRIITN